MKDYISQSNINNIWSKQWIEQGPVELRSILNNRLFVEGYPVFKKYIFHELGQKILEIGAGSGRYGIAIARDFPESEVLITDIIDEPLLSIQKYIQALGLKNVGTKKEDVLSLTFEDNTFDIVFCDAVIQHIPEYTLAIKEMKRVLKPGGKLIFSSVNYWNFPHTIVKKLYGKKYMYGYEKSFSNKEFKNIAREHDVDIIAQDGFYFAYGIFRLKYINGIFRLIGRVLNRVTKIMDRFTNRLISRKFGFEIFIVAQKKSNESLR